MRRLGGARMRFQDRVDGGRQLADRLTALGLVDPVVLALPRGGVPVGFEVARALGAPLDVLVARKLGAPLQPELGIGAVAPGGVVVLDPHAEEVPGVTPAYVEQITARERAEMERRLRLYRGDRPPRDLAGRTAILVDDGLATGVTARAAARSARLLGAERVALAVPVCAARSADALLGDADRVVCVHRSDRLRAIGEWYARFGQTADEEVLALLARPPDDDSAGRRG